MPLRSVVATRPTRPTMVFMFEDVFTTEGADCAYLRIVHAKFGSVVQNWMNMQSGVSRLPSQLAQTMNKAFL